MHNNKEKFAMTRMLVIISYFLVTTAVFLVSVEIGNKGVSIPLFGGGDDGNFYWEQAMNRAQGLPTIDLTIYVVIIGKLVSFTGIHSPYIIRLFNQIGFLLLLHYSFTLIDLQHGNRYEIETQIIYKQKFILSVCYLFYLSLITMVNLSIYRDVWIYALFAASASYYIKVVHKRRLRNIPLLILSVWLLYGFRTYAAASIIVAIIAYHGYRFLKKLISVKKMLVLVILLLSVYYTFHIDSKVPVVSMTLRDALGYRMQFLEEYAGGSQMWISLDQPNVILFVLHYIYSFIGNAIGPLPWHISGWSTLLVFFVETIPIIYILRCLYRERRSFSEIQKYLLTNALVWFALIAITNDNMGAATRLRVPAWIMLMLVFVVTKTREQNSYQVPVVNLLNSDIKVRS